MDETRYKLIVTIVNQGKSGKVIDVAHDAGASGATVVNGHGAKVRFFLGLGLDPEKELVIIVIEEEKAQTVIEAITRGMELESPHKGLTFMLSLDQIYGFNASIEDEEF